ncbi:MAG: glycoside hydrolase family 3 [Candidatus Cyclonatronum sp.]|uniref:glycoside hydrolase family 3 protein n=1 Tax=Cyclonatronum sp. TaxID=3024185 RepID=UPI0025C15ED1|nr:glycoside hydrolase family 3 N-terminal domain-containing protein [Cyclonatronum sp.]MCC5932686.1 glycoside hydrolase family 3 protein [Balneolales bacterium]MCH8486997.1 glycoside hydrolase family 3 [Cyclonatronum sp.]
MSARFAATAFVFFLFMMTGPVAWAQDSGAENRSEESGPGLEAMIGQMMMVGFRGFEADEAHWVVQDIRDRNLGGIILFDYDVPNRRAERNVRSPQQLARLVRQLQRHAETPLLVAIDQEGGRVNRLKPRFGFPETPSHEHLGRINRADSTLHYARQTGRMLAEAGISINFSPVVDVNVNPQNPVIGQLGRSFSGDAGRVTHHARLTLEGFREEGVWGTVKHFPGHGSAWNDSHYGMADVTETWTEAELEPYRDLFADGSARLVMSAHIFNADWHPEHPATLVPEIMTGLLRDELGFTGLLFSDDMQMGAITDFYGLEQALELAVLAGIDVLVFANNSVYDPEITRKAIAILSAAVEEGRIPRARIEQAYGRIMAFKARM